MALTPWSGSCKVHETLARSHFVSVHSDAGWACLSLHGGAATYNTEASMFAGAHDVDQHFRNALFEDNIAVMLGLMGVWNITFPEVSRSGHPAIHAGPLQACPSHPAGTSAFLLHGHYICKEGRKLACCHVTCSSGHKPCARLMQDEVPNCATNGGILWRKG